VTNSNQVTAETIARTQKRVTKLSDRELLDWAEIAVPGMQRHLDLYRRTDDDGHLMELTFAEMQFSIVLVELLDRHAARREELLTPS
jgi:hypothetical protein